MAADLHIERRLFHILLGSVFPVTALFLEQGLFLLVFLPEALPITEEAWSNAPS